MKEKSRMTASGGYLFRQPQQIVEALKAAFSLGKTLPANLQASFRYTTQLNI